VKEFPMRRTVIVTGVAAALGLGFAAPAPASTTGAITTTVTLSGTPTSGLSITVPPAADLDTYATGTTNTSGLLGPVTVTDARALLVAARTAVVSSTSFATGGATPAETILNTDVRPAAGLATATTGIGVFLPGRGVPMNATYTADTLTAGVGEDSASWDPTITVTPPVSTAAGVYNATITHSVC
jgi:hypothetical protein